MLKNKKKLRRQERRTPGYAARAAQTLMLAGLLLAPAMAAAAPVTWGGAQNEHKPITQIHGSEDFTSDVDFKAGFTVDGSTNGAYVGLNSALYTLTISGGTSTMSNGAGFWIGKGITISGADTVINASGIMATSSSANARWRAGTMIGADKGLSMAGGTVNLSDNAQIVVGYEGTATGAGTSHTGMQITGGTVNMSNALLVASSVATTNNIVFADNKTYTTITVGGGSGAAIVQTAAGTHNVIASRHTTIGQKGELNINGTTMLVGAMKDGAVANAGTKPTGAPEAWMFVNQAANGKLINSGGSIAVADSGVLIAAGIDFEQSAGSFTTGALTLAPASTASFKEGSGAVFKSATVSGGTVEVANTMTVNTGGTLAISGTGVVYAKAVDVKGTVTVAGTDASNQGKLHVGLPTNEGYFAPGTLTIDATNGQLNIGNFGYVRQQGDLAVAAGLANAGTAGTVSVAAGGTLKVNGVFSVKNDTAQTSTAAGTVIVDRFVSTKADGSADVKHTWNGGTLCIKGKIDDGSTAFLKAAGFDIGGTVRLGDVGDLPSANPTLGGVADPKALHGTYDNTITVKSSGALEAMAGNWKIKEINVESGGAFRIANSNIPAMQGATHVEVETLKVHSGASDFVVGSLGSLKTGVNQFGTITNGVFAKNGTVAKTLTNKGTLILTGYTGDMTLAQLGALSAAGGSQISTGGGVIKIAGANITLQASDTLNEVANANAWVGDKTVNVATGTTSLSGSATVKNLHAKTDGNVNIEVNSKNFTMVGTSSGEQLVSGLTGNNKVIVDGALTMGDSTGESGYTGGILKGDITGTGTAVNGDFTVTGNVGAGAEAVSGKLNVGGNVAGGATAIGGAVTVGGDVTGGASATGAGSSVNVAGNVTGNAVATGGSVVVQKDLTGGAHIKDGGSLTVAGTLANGANDIVVGGANDTSSSTMSIGVLDQGAGGLFVDPAFVNGVYNPAQVAIGSFKGGVTAETGVGRNSQVTIGTTDTAWLDNQVRTMNAWSKDGGATGVTAALGIYAPTTMTATGSIIVDGGMVNNAAGTGMDKPAGTAVTFNAKEAIFGDNSLLVVNSAAGVGGKTALTGAGTGSKIDVADTAKLRIGNAQSGQSVSILKSFDAMVGNAGKGWSEKSGNLTTDSHMLYGVLDVDTTAKTVSVDIHARAAAGVFPKLSNPMASFIDGFYAQGAYDVDSPAAGVRFISRATNNQYMPSTEAAAATIEGAAQMGAVAGVQISTMGAANAGASAATTRTSFAQPLMDMTKAVAVHQDVDGTLSLDSGLSAGDGMKNGLGVWIMPLYQSNRTWGQKAENFKTGMSSDLGGISLGADYTIDDMFRFGAAFNVGGGYAQSSGDFNKTDNNFNFWGVNLYGGWSMDNFGLSADVGYTSSYNKVEQDMPSSMAMGNLKSDITSSAWTAGLKGEYKFDAGLLDIIPHVGVRYMGLTTDSYDVKSGGTVFSVKEDFQSIWTFPVGVALSKTLATDSGWMFKPQMDLSVIPATGDVKAKSKASVPGVMGEAEMKMQVVDYVTFDGGVGLEMGKDNLSFGVNYNIQASEHRTGHGVFGTLRYEF